MSEMDKSENLILWSGLKQLYCIKRLQNIEHFPSDLVWAHKTKNVYLLELQRAIKEPKWREWLNICFNVITPMEKKSKVSGGPIPPDPDFLIDSNAQKTLIPFLIRQTLKDKYLQDNVLQKLTAEHSEKILNQFMDRIERSDITYSVFQRNRFIAKRGNHPLRRHIRYDAEFTETVNGKLHELAAVDRDLAEKFKKCWTEWDDTFKRLTSNRKPDEEAPNPFDFDLNRRVMHKEGTGNDGHSAEEMEAILDGVHHDEGMGTGTDTMSNAVCWDEQRQRMVTMDELRASDDDGDGDGDAVSADGMDARDRLIHKSLQHFIATVPSSYRAHHNLLRHTMDDCAKLAMLDPDLLHEGYTGDNGHFKWGLWRANNLPIFTVRPHLLALRDILTNPHLLGAYVEIAGKYGTGKSLALMYAVNIARSMKDRNGESSWLCLYCPNTHEWVQKIKLTVPANDRDAVFYQHDYARDFFRNIEHSERQKLKQIPLQNKYQISRLDEEGKGVDLEMVYAMLEDPVDIKRHESMIIGEWMRMGSGHRDCDGALRVSDPSNRFETLHDLVVYALSEDCQAPGSVMYDFMDEVRKQEQFKVLVACDNIDWWNNFVYGLTTPRNPKVFAWQLSMIDIMSQFQQVNALRNGIVVMSKTTMGKNRSAQFKTQPSHIIHCPDTYTNDEFDAVMWNYQGIRLCSSNIAPDDYKKVYASSAKRPIYAQRIASLY